MYPNVDCFRVFWYKLCNVRNVFVHAVMFISRSFIIQSLFCKRFLFDSDLLFPQETNLHFNEFNKFI